MDGLEEKVIRSLDFYAKGITGGQVVFYKNTRCKVFAKQKPLKFKMIRYVDAFVVFGANKKILEIIKFEIIFFIQKRGLFLCQTSASILNFQKKSFNFLSYTFKYRRC